jgi:hypothetical protein
MNKDITVQKALARRAELQAEIDRIDVFLAVYAQLAEGRSAAEEPTQHPVAEARLSGGSATVDTTNQDIKEAPSRNRDGIPQHDFDKLARQLLIDRGRPIQPDELLSLFRQKGRRIGGHDEYSNFKTKLWRAKDRQKLTLIPGAGYWPKDVPCQEVGYSPAQEERRRP